MSISHDHYLMYTTPNVMDETLAFHAKGNYVIHKTTHHLSTLHQLPLREIEKLTGNELRLNILAEENGKENIELPGLSSPHPLQRNDSCERFSKPPLHFDTVRSLLAPLLAKHSNTHKRGYPSGGALYPIEVFCVNLTNTIEQWPSEQSALHLLPSSRSLEVHTPHLNSNQLARAILPTTADIGSPSLALIYVIYLPKALFKYRYRGYRLALMEAGSMYMLTDLRCKELNLDSRPWSGFTDHQITKYLNLNPTLFLPACIQLIG